MQVCLVAGLWRCLTPRTFAPSHLPQWAPGRLLATSSSPVSCCTTWTGATWRTWAARGAARGAGASGMLCAVLLLLLLPAIVNMFPGAVSTGAACHQVATSAVVQGTSAMPQQRCEPHAKHAPQPHTHHMHHMHHMHQQAGSMCTGSAPASAAAASLAPSAPAPQSYLRLKHAARWAALGVHIAAQARQHDHGQQWPAVPHARLPHHPRSHAHNPLQACDRPLRRPHSSGARRVQAGGSGPWRGGGPPGGAAVQRLWRRAGQRAVGAGPPGAAGLDPPHAAAAHGRHWQGGWQGGKVGVRGRARAVWRCCQGWTCC